MLFKDRSEVNKLREDYIKSLKAELKSLSSKDELCTHPELLFYSKNKRLRRFSDKGRSIDVTEDSLQEYLAKEHYVITFGVDIFEIYKAIVDYLYGLAHCCIYGKEYLMYLCKLKALKLYPDEGTIFDNPDGNFANINDVLCFIKPTSPLLYIPITAKNFKLNLLKSWPDMTDTLKQRIVKNLKRTIEKTYFPKDNKGIFDFNFHNIFYHENTFYCKKNYGEINPKHNVIPTVSFELPRERIIVHERTYNFFNTIFEYSDGKETPTKTEAFIDLAKMAAAAYMTSYKYNVATIIHSKEFNKFSYLLGLIFYRDVEFLHPSDYNNEDFQNTNHFASYFNNKKLLVLLEDNFLMAQFEQLRNLVQANAAKTKDPVAGVIKYKNRRPVMIIAPNAERAKKIAKNFKKSKIIDFNFPLDQAISQVYSYPVTISNIKMALILLGMKLLHEQGNCQHEKKLKELTDENIENKFIEKYCSESKSDFVSKTMLKKAFMDFTEKCYPQYRSRPIQICNRLLDFENTESAKKRIIKDTNPVAVIKGVYFDKLRFKADMEKVADEPETDTPPKKQPTSIVELLDSLSECEIRTVVDTDIKS